MDSVCRTNVEIDSSVKQTSDTNFQQNENYNVIESILENYEGGKNVGESENTGSVENEKFHTANAETEEESKDVKNAKTDAIEMSHSDVISSPKTEQNLLEIDLTEQNSNSKGFNLEYNGICSQELSKTDNADGDDCVYILPSHYSLKSPNYKEDEEAYFKCNQRRVLFEESDQSDSRSSFSSCDASFSHSDDEECNSKKCTIQTTPNSGFTYNYNDFLEPNKNSELETKLTIENNLINESIINTKTSSQIEIKTENDVFLQKSSDMENNLSQTKDDTEIHPSSQTEAKIEKKYNIVTTLNSPRYISTTNSDKTYRNQDSIAGSESYENVSFVKDDKETADIKAYPTSHSATSTNSVNSYKSLDIDANSKSTENINFVKPDEETAAKIMNRVEFYFSDFNILKNNFLLKHTRKNKEGYVSLKLVTSFRKVKAITKDWRVVAYSLANSKILKLNPEKTKVCRFVPIPNIEDTSFGKTVVVFNMPFQNPFSEHLKEMFGKFGKIMHAEVMTSKSKNFNLYHKKCLFFNRDVASSTFGVVEFETYKDAQKAVNDDESYLPKENEMIVVPLVAKYYKFKPKKSFRYKSVISYPRNAYSRYYPHSEYPRDIYAVNGANAAPYEKYYYDQQVPRSNYTYSANYGYYSQRPDPRKYYDKQKMIANNYSTSKSAPKYSNGSVKYSEYWRQNRHLKANTSMNIDKRFVSSKIKIDAS